MVTFVNVEIKDLNDNGLDGYYCSMDVLRVLQFGGGWNLSGTLPQNGILAPLVDLLASPQVKTPVKGFRSPDSKDIADVNFHDSAVKIKGPQKPNREPGQFPTPRSNERAFRSYRSCPIISPLTLCLTLAKVW